MLVRNVPTAQNNYPEECEPAKKHRELWKQLFLFFFVSLLKKKSKIQTKFPLYFPAVIIPLTNLNLNHITASPTQHRCLRMDNSCLSIGISKENIKYNKPAGMGLTRLPSAENSPERNRQKKITNQRIKSNQIFVCDLGVTESRAELGIQVF